MTGVRASNQLDPVDQRVGSSGIAGPEEAVDGMCPKSDTAVGRAGPGRGARYSVQAIPLHQRSWPEPAGSLYQPAATVSRVASVIGYMPGVCRVRGVYRRA